MTRATHQIDLERVLLAAESLFQGFEDGVYEAETAKFEACEPIIEAARARVAGVDYSGRAATRQRNQSSFHRILL